MTLDQLMMLKAVADCGSLRGASELLHKTQPSISQGIRQLERQLGITLFDRDAYRLALTESGKSIYQHALRLLNEATTIKQVAKHLSSGNEATVTLAFEASFDLTRILPLLEITQNEFPNTQIILRQEYLTGAIETLSTDRADIVISPVNIGAHHYGQMELTLLHQGKLVDVASPRLLLRHPNLTFSSELLNEYQIIVQDTGKGTKNIEYGVQDGQRRWYVNDFHTKKMLILSGMGWGKLPDYLIVPELESGTLNRFKLQDKQNEVSLSYYAIKMKNNLLGPVASKLWKHLSFYLEHQQIQKISGSLAI